MKIYAVYDEQMAPITGKPVAVCKFKEIAEAMVKEGCGTKVEPIELNELVPEKYLGRNKDTKFMVNLTAEVDGQVISEIGKISMKELSTNMTNSMMDGLYNSIVGKDAKK